MSHKPHERHKHEDVYVAVRDALDAVRRRLKGSVRESPECTQAHKEPPEGRLARLFLQEGYGFISTTNRREIYFHQNTVLDQPFDGLGAPGNFHAASPGNSAIGAPRRLASTSSDGPHAEAALTVGVSNPAIT